MNSFDFSSFTRNLFENANQPNSFDFSTLANNSGTRGADGADGAGINGGQGGQGGAGIVINSNTSNVIRGADGADGVDGINGEDGQDGEGAGLLFGSDMIDIGILNGGFASSSQTITFTPSSSPQSFSSLLETRFSSEDFTPSTNRFADEDFTPFDFGSFDFFI